MRFYKVIFSLFFLVLTVMILRGQNIPYKLYTPHDGLAQSQVTCMFQDSRGYIWLVTQGGLSYFNGTKFQSILPKDGLPSSAIGQIQEDAKGNIWFSTGKWLCKYDGKKVTADTTSIRLKAGYFCLDNEKTMWVIGANDNKLYYSKDWKNWTCASDEFPALKDKKWVILDFDPTFNRLNLNEIADGFYVFNKKELKKLYSSPINFTTCGNNMRQNLGFVKDSYPFEQIQLRVITAQYSL